jgi:hypothetical protein
MYRKVEAAVAGTRQTTVPALSRSSKMTVLQPKRLGSRLPPGSSNPEIVFSGRFVLSPVPASDLDSSSSWVGQFRFGPFVCFAILNLYLASVYHVDIDLQHDLSGYLCKSTIRPLSGVESDDSLDTSNQTLFPVANR